MKVLDEIEARYSPLAFSEKLIPQKEINLLFEAAKRAASSYNEQPWRFIYASKGEAGYTELFDCVMDFNRSWADKAPLLVLAIAKKNFTHSDQPNRHALYDLGHAVANMSAQATSMNIYLRQMGGYDAQKAKNIFGVSEEYETVAMIAFGYLGKVEDLPEKIRERAEKRSSRMEIEDFTFKGKWRNSVDK